MKAFAEAEIVSDFKHGAEALAQAHGIGVIQANTVLMGWSRREDGRVRQMHLMRDMVRLRKSVLFLRYDYERGFGNYRRIHVWWQGRGGNEDLMVLFAHLIEQHNHWRNAKIRMLRVVNDERGIDEVRAHMAGVLSAVRVKAEPVVIVREPGQRIGDIMTQHKADLTIIGMHYPREEEVEAYSRRIHELVCDIGSVLLVRNAEIDQDLLTPD
jgi:hypothetical protein